MRTVHSRKGFTLIELLVVVAIITVLIGVLLPALGHVRDMGGRTVCSSRLSGIYKGLNAYSVSSQNNFPTYSSTPTNACKVFQYPARNDSSYSAAVSTAIADSVTAPLWALVRDGTLSAKNFLCPGDMTTKEDTFMVNYTTARTSVKSTWDFNTIGNGSAVATSSYSSVDMYETKGGNWNPRIGANWVLMGDNNNNDGIAAAGATTGTLHSYSKFSTGLTTNILKGYENSSLHRFEGQNFMFGDGHVAFSNDPFTGPGGDNVYSHKTSATTEAQATTFVHNDTAFNNTDVVLLPVLLTVTPSVASAGP